MVDRRRFTGLKNVGWAGIEAVSSVLVSVVALLGIAKLIGPTEFGLGALGLGTVQILTVVLGSLFHDALVRDPEVDERHVNAAWTISLLLALVAFGLCVALSSPFAGYYGAPELGPVFVAFAFTLIPDAVVAPLIAERRRALDFRLVTVQYLLARALGALIGVAMAFAGYGVWSMVGQQVVTSLVGLVIMVRRVPFTLRPSFALGLLKPLLAFTSSIIATQFVIQLAQRLLLFYVGRVSGVTAAGYWGLADRIIDTLQRTVTNALYHVSLSHFAKVQDQPARLGTLVHEANGWLVPAIFPGLLIVAVFATDIIGLILGEAWLPAGVATQVLALGAVIQLRRLMDHVSLNALGHADVAFQAYLLEAGLVIAALFLVSPTALAAVAIFRAVQPVFGYLLIAQRAMVMTER
ncbi:MAG: oligosaccharide flippase family protein, partial [Alphaproteobacteria bacterium]|nr:oligosaccharide flippase family protein [Alphaproteobacteria bacterium]